MNRWLRALALTAAGLVLAMGAAADRRKSKEDLEQDLAQHQTRLEKLRKRMNETKAVVRERRFDMREVDGDLDRIRAEMARTERELEQSRARLRELTVERSQAALRMTLKEDQLSRRLRTIYKQGEARFVSALVGTESVGDLAGRSYILRRIAAKDHDIATEFQQAKEELDGKCAEQADLVEAIKDKMSRQLDEQERLRAALAEKEAAYRQALEEHGRRQSEYFAENAATQQIEAELASYYATTGAGATKPWSGYYLKPVEGPMTSGYGMRFHPILKTNKMHTGIDIAAPHGTPIKAAADGKVIKAEYVNGYGNCVILDHGGGYATLYAHCSRILVTVGQLVKQRDVIANVGATGLATGPHVHFELRINGKPVKPN